MPPTLTASLAPNIILSDGYTVRVTALDPTTGAVVNGVTVSNVSMQVDTEDAEPEPETAAPVPAILGYVPQEAA